MKFSEIVSQAKEAASRWKCTVVVYQDLNSRWWNKIRRYSYTSKARFNTRIEAGVPLVRLLLIRSDGRMVQ